MEVTLNFSLNAKGWYQAKAKVGSNYTIHLERSSKGKVNLFVKSVENGKYCPSVELCGVNSDEVYEQDIMHGNVNDDCPKWILITSQSQVTSGKIIGDSVESIA